MQAHKYLSVRTTFGDGGSIVAFRKGDVNKTNGLGKQATYAPPTRVLFCSEAPWILSRADFPGAPPKTGLDEVVVLAVTSPCHVVVERLLSFHLLLLIPSQPHNNRTTKQKLLGSVCTYIYIYISYRCTKVRVLLRDDT